MKLYNFATSHRKIHYITKLPAPTVSNSSSASQLCPPWQLLPHSASFDSDTFQCTHPYGWIAGDHSGLMLTQNSFLGPSCRYCTHHRPYLLCIPSGSTAKPASDGSLAYLFDVLQCLNLVK